MTHFANHYQDNFSLGESTINYMQESRVKKNLIIAKPSIICKKVGSKNFKSLPNHHATKY
jgi:hypothetical protein